MEYFGVWGAKNASLQPDRFDSGACLRAPAGRGAKESRRIVELRAPERGLNDAPVASRGFMRKFLVS